jgi:hypothetical protein
MSWLYTLFVAGFLFANSSDHQAVLNAPDANETLFVQRSDELVERIDQMYPLNADGRISLSNVNGSVTIEAWDRNEVHLEAVKKADSKESMDMIQIDIESRPDQLSIESDFKSWKNPNGLDRIRNRKMEVQFRLQVPRTAVLNEIEAVNGSITVSNFVNLTKVSAVNGAVLANNLRGTAKLSTVNGEVRANFDRLEPGSSIDLETVNGRVNVEVPSDINATIKADSLNGSIENAFGLPVKKGKYVGRDLHGRIGTGEVPLHLSSVNGTLMIGRKKDGRNPTSVTNLLKVTKDEADEDADDDSDDVSVAVETRSRESVAAAVNKSTKAAQKSVKSAEKAVELVGPGLEKIEVPVMPDMKIKDFKIKDDFKMDKAFKDLAVYPEIADVVWSGKPTTVDQRTRSFEVKGASKVNIDAPMCAVRVRGWDRSTVKYVLTEERFSRENALSINENVNDSTVAIKVSNGTRAPRVEEMWGVENRFRMEVYVPRKTDLTVNTEKEIRVEGITGRIELSGDDDSVSVRDSEGTLKLHSGDGLIRIVGFKGDLDLTASDAEIYLEGDFAKISSCAGSSNITLTMPSTRNASISTNTAIQSEGLNVLREGDRTWRVGNGGPKYDFEFADGKLVLRNQSFVDVN